MKMKKVALGLAAAATLVASVGVPAVAAQRAIAPVEEGSDAAGGASILIGLAAAAAVIAGIMVASDGGENELPVSG
jgi:hypothetical protein